MRAAREERGNEENVLREIESIIRGGAYQAAGRPLLKGSNLSLLTQKLIKGPPAQQK